MFLNKLINKLLTILTEINCVLVNSTQEFIEIEAWLLLTFLLCLQNQLSSMHSIYKNLFIKQTENERLLLSASFIAKFELVFVLTQKNTFS